MKVKLRLIPPAEARRLRYRQHTHAAPFVVSERRWLIHRPRYVHTHLDGNGKDQHSSVECWCSTVAHDYDLTDNPPRDRLLCAMCEAKAVAAGEPSAKKLAGRHVHIGRMKPVRLCCRNNEN